MSLSVTNRPARSRSEEAAIVSLVERLAAQFPELSEEEIARAVHGRYEQFDDSRVRDFVPVLVERAVRRDVFGDAPRHRA